MSESAKKPVSVRQVIIDGVLTIAFFLYMWQVMKIHVPSTDPRMIETWAAITSACMTGVFWLAWQMIKVVYRFQHEQSRR